MAQQFPFYVSIHQQSVSRCYCCWCWCWCCERVQSCVYATLLYVEWCRWALHKSHHRDGENNVCVPVISKSVVVVHYAAVHCTASAECGSIAAGLMSANVFLCVSTQTHRALPLFWHHLQHRVLTVRRAVFFACIQHPLLFLTMPFSSSAANRRCR